MFTIFGLLGQSIYNSLDAQHTKELQLASHDGKPASSPFWRRVANSKWSPMKVLTDEEYEKMLRERLLRVNAEIVLVDENIEKLRVEQVRGPPEDDITSTRNTNDS